MHILQIIQGLTLGGPETCLINFLRHIDREQFRIDIMVHHPQRDYYNEECYFELTIPNDILLKADEWGGGGTAYFGNKKIQLGEKTEAFQKSVKEFMEAVPNVKIFDYFYVEASLIIKNKIDLKDKKEIKIINKS